MTGDLKSFKAEIERADYVRMGQWSDAGVCIQWRVLDLIAEVKRLRPKNRVYPCGCVTCICEDEIKCHGCGAVGCGQPGMPAEHTPGAQPMSIPKLRAEVERLTKRCEDARYIIASDVLAPQDLKHSWLEGRP